MAKLMRSQLKSQVEEILDTDEGLYRDVILRIDFEDPVSDSIVEAATETIRRRSLSVSARNLLPAAFDTITASKGRSRQRKLSQHDTSLASQILKSAVPHVHEAAIGTTAASIATSALIKILNSGAVKNALASASRRNKKPKTKMRKVLWSSNSLRLKILKEDLSDMVANTPSIADVYPNRQLSPPSYFRTEKRVEGEDGNQTSTWGVESIRGLAAWGAYGAKGNGVKVAVLDTGVDPSHPDLMGKIKKWAVFDSSGNTVLNSTPHDTDEHGTHVCGTIAGGNASGEWIGVAPETELHAGMVLDGQKGGTDAQVLAGIDWAINNSVDVINMSLGGLTLGPDVPNTYSRSILRALQAGIVVVAAIGNEGNQTSGSPGNDLFAFSTGAIDQKDRAAGFSGGRTQIIRRSNFLAPEMLPLPYSKPDISAPGVGVYSSVPGGKWMAFNGTSMATPHVSGAIAALISATSIKDLSPDRRAFTIQDLITGTVDEMGESGQDHRYGFGKINLLRAIGTARANGF